MRRLDKRRINPLYVMAAAPFLVILGALLSSGVILLFGVLAVLALFYPVFITIWNQIYGLEDLADRVFFATTSDGWKIALHYHEPVNPRPGAFPVVLCHGILVNKYCVDMDRKHSLAYYLKQNGYPVFAVSLRGTGRSRHMSKSGYKDYNFDDIVENDVPAILRTVRELTGAPKVSWIGHSMGAMIIYGFLGRKLPGHEDIATLISLAGPGRVDHVHNTYWGFLIKAPRVNRALNLRFGSQAITPLSGHIITPIEEVVYDKENLTSVTIRRLMKNGVESVSDGLYDQMSSWVKMGKEMTRDSSFDYREGQKNIVTPSLFIAGKKDKIAPPSTIHFTYDQVRSKQKSYMLMGRQSGNHKDYCHVGLVLGESAAFDVFPPIEEWLEQYGNEKKLRSLSGSLNRMRTAVNNRRHKKTRTINYG